MVATGDEARSRGVLAGPLVKLAAPVIGGKGGGKDDFAQGGGTDGAGAAAALTAVEREIDAVVGA